MRFRPTLILCMIVMVLSAFNAPGTDMDPWPPGFEATPPPGVIGTVGNAQTISYLFGLTEFDALPAYPRHYYSSTGTNSSDCTDSASPCQTLHHLDTLIEGTANIIVVMDGDGVWNTTAEIDGSTGDFDGGLGPPLSVGDLERPAVIIISDETNVDPFNIDCTNLTEAQRAAGAGSRGIFQGVEGGEGAAQNTGWMYVSNAHVDNCPSNNPRIEATAAYADITRGNIVTLNFTTVDLIGHNRQFYSAKGSAGIHINPVWNHLDFADFDADCDGADDPYEECTGAGNAEGNTQFIWNIDGAVILISNQTYTWANSQPHPTGSGATLIGTTAGSAAGSDMVVIGPTLVMNVTPDRPVSAISGQPCGVSGAEINYDFAYLDIRGFNTADDKGFYLATGTIATDCQHDIQIYETHLRDIGYIGVQYYGTATSQTSLNSLTLNCVEMEALAISGYLVEVDNVLASGSQLLNIEAIDSKFDAAPANDDFFLGNLGYAESVSDFRTLVDAQDEIYCGGSGITAVENCSDGWLEVGDGVYSEACRQEMTITLPTDVSGDAAGTKIDAWLPAILTGNTIKSFVFGGKLD